MNEHAIHVDVLVIGAGPAGLAAAIAAKKAGNSAPRRVCMADKKAPGKSIIVMVNCVPV